ncbi:MAG TPA: VWA domain-containing protein [Blastocatellia bacterium]|nr:VWA domain-containing protein [Blastocatellia bacterium]
MMSVRPFLSFFLSFIVIAAIFATVVEGQSGRRLPGTRPQQQDDTIRLRAEEVLLNVTVLDPYGRQATDLQKPEFIVAEDNQRQDLASFAVSSVPVNVVLMLDASGSVVGEVASLREAAMRFVEQLGPEDKVSITEFHTDIELIQDWTSDPKELQHAISWRFKPGMVRTKEGRTTYGTTSLYDALYATAEEQLSKVEGRKAIIILSDGDDTSSKVTYEQALAAVVRSGAVVYVVSKARAIMAIAGKFYRARFERAEHLMKNLATRTGGDIFSPLKDEEMKDIYARVARELKNQYIITYISKNEKRDGALRRVSVYLTRSGYSARTRDSYYAPKN